MIFSYYPKSMNANYLINKSTIFLHDPNRKPYVYFSENIFSMDTIIIYKIKGDLICDYYLVSHYKNGDLKYVWSFCLKWF
jgi:hypothetical protein